MQEGVQTCTRQCTWGPRHTRPGTKRGNCTGMHAAAPLTAASRGRWAAAATRIARRAGRIQGGVAYRHARAPNYLSIVPAAGVVPATISSLLCPGGGVVHRRRQLVIHGHRRRQLVVHCHRRRQQRRGTALIVTAGTSSGGDGPRRSGECWRRHGWWRHCGRRQRAGLLTSRRAPAGRRRRRRAQRSAATAMRRRR